MDFFSRPPPKPRHPGGSLDAPHSNVRAATSHISITKSSSSSIDNARSARRSAASKTSQAHATHGGGGIVITSVKRTQLQPLSYSRHNAPSSPSSSARSGKPIRLNALPEEHWRKLDEEREAKRASEDAGGQRDLDRLDAARLKKRKKTAKTSSSSASSAAKSKKKKSAKRGKGAESGVEDDDDEEAAGLFGGEESEEEAQLTASGSDIESGRDSDEEYRLKRKERRRRAKEEKRLRKEKRAGMGPTTPTKGSATPTGSHGSPGEGFRVLGRAGVASSYDVARDVCDLEAFEARDGYAVGEPAISSAEIVERQLKKYGPYFYGIEEDVPRLRLEYPAPGASEEFILLAPRDLDEYDPISDLLQTIRTIVAFFVPASTRDQFGSLDDLTSTGTAKALLQRNEVSGVLEPARNGSSSSNAASPAAAREGSATPSHTSNGASATTSTAKSAILAAAGVGSATPGPAPPSTLPSPLPAPSRDATNAADAPVDPDPILRSLAKARNRHDGPLLLRSVARFNAILSRLKAEGAVREHLQGEGSRSGIRETVWHQLQEQCYARTVAPRVEELTKYEAFSDNVYGELLPRFMSEISQLTSLRPGSVFIDLGSGVSNLLVQVALQTGADCYGVEQMQVASELGALQVREAKRRWRMYGLKAGECASWQGDFGDDNRVREVLRNADVIIVNNYAFTAQTNDKLSLLFLDLKDGAQIVSLKPFVPADFRLTERTLSSPLAILSVAQRSYTSGCVSWADGGGRYYIHTVDRSNVARFLEDQERTSISNGRKRGRSTATEKRRWKAAVESEDEDDEA